MKKAFIVGGKRTPIGSLLGGLQSMTATQLASVSLKALLESTKVSANKIDHVILGNVLSTGLGQNPARQASLGAGIDVTVPCTNVNKVCASGMKATMYGALEIQAGQADVVVTGGFESMTNAPHFMRVRQGVRFGDTVVCDTVSHDGLVDAYNKAPMGFCGEKTAKEFGITREIQDEFCVASYERVLEATKSRRLEFELTPVDVPKRGLLVADEEPLRYNREKVSTLKPAFPDAQKNGTITSANASKINDGACSLMLMSESALASSGLKPLAEIIAFADAEGQPLDFNLTPPLAAKKALARANLTINDIDFWEVNEAFSVTGVAFMKQMGVDHQRLNVHGGAVALGHPIGMSGARIILSLVNVLQCWNGKFGCATICNGGGGASAIIIKRVN